MSAYKSNAFEEPAENRPAYRAGRRLTAVKVYTVNQESRYLVVENVPAIGLSEKLVELFALYGTVEEYRHLDDYEAEEFTDVFWIKFSSLPEARAAKRKLDDYNFYQSPLRVRYGPEYETVQDTREKLQERRNVVAAKTSGQKDTVRPFVSSRSTSSAVTAETSRQLAQPQQDLSAPYNSSYAYSYHYNYDDSYNYGYGYAYNYNDAYYYAEPPSQEPPPPGTESSTPGMQHHGYSTIPWMPSSNHPQASGTTLSSDATENPIPTAAVLSRPLQGPKLADDPMLSTIQAVRQRIKEASTVTSSTRPSDETSKWDKHVLGAGSSRSDGSAFGQSKRRRRI